MKTSLYIPFICLGAVMAAACIMGQMTRCEQADLCRKEQVFRDARAERLSGRHMTNMVHCCKTNSEPQVSVHTNLTNVVINMSNYTSNCMLGNARHGDFCTPSNIDIYQKGSPVSIIRVDGFDLPGGYGITTNTKARFQTSLKPLLCVSNGEVVLRFEEGKLQADSRRRKPSLFSPSFHPNKYGRIPGFLYNIENPYGLIIYVHPDGTETTNFWRTPSRVEKLDLR